MSSFPKIEKLYVQHHIDSLYHEGKHFVVWPLRVTYLPSEEMNQVLIWAPKSLFRHAVDRNKLRRQIRETYRLNKHLLTGHPLYVAFNYIDKQMQPYPKIEHAMVKAIHKLNSICP